MFKIEVTLASHTSCNCLTDFYKSSLLFILLHLIMNIVITIEEIKIDIYLAVNSLSS